MANEGGGDGQTSDDTQEDMVIFKPEKETDTVSDKDKSKSKKKSNVKSKKPEKEKKEKKVKAEKAPRPKKPKVDKPKKDKDNSLSCWFGCYATRQLAKNRNRQVYIRVTLREFIIYLFYLVVICIITIGNVNPSTFYFTKVISDLFLDTPLTEGAERTFRTSLTRSDFWEFANHVMLKGIYETGSTLNIDPNGQEISILYENKLLGHARLRQLRVKNETCPAAVYSHKVRDCYPSYTNYLKETDPAQYNPENMDEFENDTAWAYFPPEELKSKRYWGKVSSYSGGGAYVILKKEINLARAQIQELQGSNWVSRSTRVVFLDFTLYNPNVNLHCIVKLVWEFAPTGGMITSWTIRTVRLYRYTSIFDYFILACQLLFVLFIIYYAIQEVIEMITMNFFDYITSIWSWLDNFQIGVSFFAIGYYIYSYIMIERLKEKESKTNFTDVIEESDQDLEINSEYENLGLWEGIINNLAAICVFIAFIKMLKFISFNRTMIQLSKTLSRCAKDICGFAFMFFIVFFAFSQLGYLLFGSQMLDFSTFWNSSFTLLRLILGDFNFREIESANRVLGPIFFISYVFFVFFVLLNMFLAIINDSYSEVKAEIQAQRSEYELIDHFKKLFNNLKGKCGRRVNQWDLEEQVKLAASNGKITFNELRGNLKSFDFSDTDIEIFLARYELNQNRALDDDEIHHVLADLEGKRNPDGTGTDYVREKEIGVQLEEFNDMQRRITGVESSITNVSQKIDSLFKTFQHLDNIGYQNIKKENNKHKNHT